MEKCLLHLGCLDLQGARGWGDKSPSLIYPFVRPLRGAPPCCPPNNLPSKNKRTNSHQTQATLFHRAWKPRHLSAHTECLLKISHVSPHPTHGKYQCEDDDDKAKQGSLQQELRYCFTRQQGRVLDWTRCSEETSRNSCSLALTW